MGVVSLLLATVLQTSATSASQPNAVPAAPPAPTTCEAPVHRQFDFWVGEWDVVPNGVTLKPDQKPASNVITKAHGSCVLVESWTTPQMTGQSFNIYDRSRGRWHQTWVDSNGGVHDYSGALDGANMVFLGSQPRAAVRAYGAERRRRSRRLDRYAAPNENFVPVMDPHSGPGARSAPKDNENQPRARVNGISRGRALGWFAVEPRVIGETLAPYDPAAVDRLDRPFSFSHGPSDATSYLLQRAVFEHVSREVQPDALFVEEAVLDVLARVVRRRFAISRDTGATAGPTRRSRDLSEAARSVLAARSHESLTLSEVARLVDSSVFHLARQFRRETGTTLHAYRNQLRLRTALERLTDAHADLLALALDLGYSSHSHFTESFRRSFGLTPSKVRGTLTSARIQALVKPLLLAGG